MPDTLFEAELFGHARASFTGAERARRLLARAEGGTLFLDELGELPLPRQAVLLRALESRRYRPVGSDDERPFDARIVAATNRDLAQAVAERAFRQDLLYRVNAIEIHVPPLRDREGDVPLLLAGYLDRDGRPHRDRAARARGARRLRMARQRAGARAPGPAPGRAGRAPRRPRAPPAGCGRARCERARAGRPPPRSAPRARRDRRPVPLRRRPRGGDPAGEARHALAEDDEREPIRRALAETGGNISRAAERLGITRHGLKKRMARLGMRAPSGSQGKAG